MFVNQLRLICPRGLFPVIGAAFLILLFYFPSYSTDYNFLEVSEVDFSPAPSAFVKYQVIDINNDGLDELIMMFRYNYYIYSFENDSILYSDTAMVGNNFCGFLATDYDGDSVIDILTMKYKGWGPYLYLQDGSFADSSQNLTAIYGLVPPSPSPICNLFYSDIDLDGSKEVIVTGLAEYFIGTDYVWYLEYYHNGYEVSLSPSDWSTDWEKDAPSAEHATFSDLDGDGATESIIWGKYLHYLKHKVYGPPDYVEEITYTYQTFGVVDCQGNLLMSAKHQSPANVLTGAFNSSTTGDDIIVFKDGASFDSTIFAPADGYGIYCLVKPDDSVRLSWGIDAESYQNYLFALESLPGTFCVSASGSQYTIFSGEDGQTVGTINGLRRLSITEEGHFLPLPDTVTQIIQIDGNKVYLYQQTSPTDISEPTVEIIPDGYYLRQNHPNPFNLSTQIEYTIPARSHVVISVYNLLGRKIETLVDEVRSPGVHSAIWDGIDANGNEVGSGVYFYQIQANGFVDSKKMLLLK